MKKVAIAGLVLVTALSVGGYYLYNALFTRAVAYALAADTVPAYVPKRFQARIQAISPPFNKGTEAVLNEMRNSGVSMTEILATIDGITEEDAYKLLDELNQVKPQTTNDVFSISKKHIHTAFDPEIFRQSFNNHVNMKDVEKALLLANKNRRTHDLDFETGKAVLKQILLEKEKEYRKKHENN